MVLYRPPDGQWARTETVDSSIVRFLLPIGGDGSAEVALEAAFSYKHAWQAPPATTNNEKAVAVNTQHLLFHIKKIMTTFNGLDHSITTLGKTTNLLRRLPEKKITGGSAPLDHLLFHPDEKSKQSRYHKKGEHC